jgi:chromosomal replication initiator protein
MNFWESIRGYLQPRISAESYDNWLKGTNFMSADGGTLLVSAPDRETRVWLETELAGMVRSGIQDLGLPIRDVRYEVQPARGLQNHTLASLDEPDSWVNALNPKFTFALLRGGRVQSICACRRAARWPPSPPHSYNPLCYLYGGVGMGKTHLMHAIGRELMNRFGSHARDLYVERTVHERNDCLHTERSACSSSTSGTGMWTCSWSTTFKSLGNKERTQEEFFHTFNELHDHQKANRNLERCRRPRRSPVWWNVLRSRFEWGLTRRYSSAPDLETKMAILDKKAEAEGVKLPDDVRSFMASKTKSNVRELEGAL